MSNIKVSDIYEFLDKTAPFNTADDWDNSGLLAGDMHKTVTRVQVSLDPTKRAVANAVKNNADLMVTHHPIIFNPLKSIKYDSALCELIKNDIAIICTHTCWDNADGGVSDTLCKTIGLTDIKKIYDENSSALSCLREGTNTITDTAEYSRFISDKLGVCVKSGIGKNRNPEMTAVCPGGGASLLPYVIEYSNAGFFVTGDAKHNDFIDAAENGITLLAAGHYETENPAALELMKRLEKEFPDIEFLFFDDPVTEYYMR